MRRLVRRLAAVFGALLMSVAPCVADTPQTVQVKVPPAGGSAAAGSPRAAASWALGGELYKSHCGICHFQMGPGAIMLERRLGPDHALLDERLDLDSDYVKAVVRAGIGGMPPQTRVDLSNAELDAVVTYLTRFASERTQPRGPIQRTAP